MINIDNIRANFLSGIFLVENCYRALCTHIENLALPMLSFTCNVDLKISWKVEREILSTHSISIQKIHFTFDITTMCVNRFYALNVVFTYIAGALYLDQDSYSYHNFKHRFK